MGKNLVDTLWPQMPEQKPKQERVLKGLRLNKELLARIERVAEKQKSSSRAVLEQLAENGIGDLEKRFGVSPERPQK